VVAPESVDVVAKGPHGESGRDVAKHDAREMLLRDPGKPLLLHVDIADRRNLLQALAPNEHEAARSPVEVGDDADLATRRSHARDERLERIEEHLASVGDEKEIIRAVLLGEIPQDPA